jgi:carnitine O-acetyltransferase
VDVSLPPPTKLTWTLDETILKGIAEAERNSKELINDTESVLLHFDGYGSNFIKEYGQASPDAYVQMALQLAWQRMYDAPTPVYESASTRLFKHGRTETNRSLTSESYAFTKSFDDDDVLYSVKRGLFHDAVLKHVSNLRDATFGKGFDRHFLGLRAMMKGDEAKQSIFDDAYMQSMWFRLSSSNMSPGRNFYGGFGPVVPDGYGINYAIDGDLMKFSVSSKRSCEETTSVGYRDSLVRSLNDLRVLFPKPVRKN